MKFNNKELADLSFGEATIEGRLHHKKVNGGYSHSVFREKWYKLRANILFYFNLSDTGQLLDKKPIGAFILENGIVQYEMISEVPFSFSIYFNDEKDKKHVFSCRTQENVNKWVEALKQASYEYWRSQLMLLQEKLQLITGQDPLLLYPRNKGCRHKLDYSSTKLSNKSNNTFKVESSKPQLNEISARNKNSSMKDTVSMKSRIQQENLESSTPVDKTDVQTPPVRPPRENKVKPEVECGILIEL